MKKICAYTRVSTDSADQENSLENQMFYFERKAKDMENVELVKIYSDKGLTGTNVNRPEFIQMLRDAGIDVSPQISKYTSKPLKNKFVYEINPYVEPMFNEIWIKNTSRFARNTLSQEIIDVLSQKGVYIYFVEQDISTKDDLNRGLLLKLFQVFDEQDSKDKSMKVMQGRKAAAMRGKVISNGRLFGYDYADHKFTINEEEAKIVREIFELYAQGLGARRILNILKKKNYKTRRNRNFGKSTINRILQNEKYTGDYTANIWDTGAIFRKKSPQLKPEDKWHIHEDAMPAIINRELFDRCQRIRAKKINSKLNRGIYQGTTLFASKVFCSRCGQVYHSNRDRGRHYYNCSGKRAGNGCGGVNIDIDVLRELTMQQIRDNFDKLRQREKHIRNSLSALKFLIETGENTPVDVAEIEAKENKINEQEKKLLDLYMENMIDKVIYEEKYNAFKSEREEINRLKLMRDDSEMVINQQCREIDDYLRMLDTEINQVITDDKFEQYLNTSVDKIFVLDKGKIEVKFKAFGLIDTLTEDKIYEIFDASNVKTIDGKVGAIRDGKVFLIDKENVTAENIIQALKDLGL